MGDIADNLAERWDIIRLPRVKKCGEDMDICREIRIYVGKKRVLTQISRDVGIFKRLMRVGNLIV